MSSTIARFCLKIILFLLLIVVCSGTASAEAPHRVAVDGEIKSTQRTTGIPALTVLNINDITSFLRADGQGNHTANDKPGLRYPRNAATAVYEDGFVWGGKMYVDASFTQPSIQLVRVGGQTYNVGTRQGAITGSAAGAVAIPPDDARARVYRIRRDYAQMSDAEFRRDAAMLNLISESDVTPAMIREIRMQYESDWLNWPVDLGAPYIERNGTPGYQAPPVFSPAFTVGNLIASRYDEPGIAGPGGDSPADQVMWSVYNDLDVPTTYNLYYSSPIGLEGQVTIWAYKRSDALGSVYYKQLKLINKGGIDVGGGIRGAFYVDSMYIAQWSDPDLGDSGDDLCGCDTLLNLGYAYNGAATDHEYAQYGLPAPAVGYDFLAGPLVVRPGSTAIVDLRKVSGRTNLPMTGFIYFSAGSPISDPLLPGQAGASYESTREWYRMLHGFRPDPSSVPERFYPFPPGVEPGPFTLTGNPVTQNGFVDGLGTAFSMPPGDRRIVLTSGPVRFAPGDTQEVVVATVAGMGADRLSSISVMKFNDTYAQEYFNSLFSVPSAPPPPKVQFAALDQLVGLEWSSDSTAVAATEQFVSQPGNYTFEGYTVYQLPGPAARLTDGRRIATYDLESDPAMVIDSVFNASSGATVIDTVQFGLNSGIRRSFVFDKDYLHDGFPLHGGTSYYLAVTAYSVSRAGLLPRSLESLPFILTVSTTAPDTGTGPGIGTFPASSIVHSGMGEADIDVRIIDPAKLQDKTYLVGFPTQPGRFSTTYSNLGEDLDANTWTRYSFSGTLRLNEDATRIIYDVRISDLDSLSGFPVSVKFALGPTESVQTYPPTPDDVNYIEIPTGSILKEVPMAAETIHMMHTGVASGVWTSSDSAQPLSASIVNELSHNRMYVVVTTAARPNGEAAGVFRVDTYPWYMTRNGSTLLRWQDNFSYTPDWIGPDTSFAVTDGLQFRIGNVIFDSPSRFTSWEQTVKADHTTPPFTLSGDYTIFAGVDSAYASCNGYGGAAATPYDYQHDLEMRFTGIRAGNAEDTIIVSGGSIATVYSSNYYSVARIRVPFELWEIEPKGRTRQINIVMRERNADGKSPWGNSGMPEYIRMSSSGRCYVIANSTPYDPSTGSDATSRIGRRSDRNTWMFVPYYSGGNHWDQGDVFHIHIKNPVVPGTDTYKFNPLGAVGIDAGVDAVAGEYSLAQNYPNPFNPSTTIRFTLKYPSNVRLKVFNVLGQAVRTLVERELTAGSHNVEFDTRGLASGVYFYRLEAGTFVSVRKMILLK